MAETKAKSATDTTRVLLVRVEPDHDPESGLQTAGYVLDEWIVDALRPIHSDRVRKMAPLAVRASVLSDRLRGRLREYKNESPVAIVIEPVQETLPPDRYYEDLIIELLRSKLFTEVPAPICCLTFFVRRPDLLASLSSYGMLMERANDNDCALCGLAHGESESDDGPKRSHLEFSVASPSSSHLESGPIIDVPLTAPVSDRREFAPLELVGVLRSQLSLEYGHFEFAATRRHFPLVLDASRLGANPAVVAGLRESMAQLVGGQSYLVDSLELDGSGLRDSLCPAIAEGNPDRLVQPGTVSGPVVVLSDFRSAVHDEEGHVDDLLRRGASSVTVLGLVDTADERPAGFPNYGLLSVEAESWNFEDGGCPYCDSGVLVHSGSHRGELTANLTEYEAELFWGMLSLSPSYLRVGHWSSPRTDNHYWLRIVMGEVLPNFGEAMAARLLRKLERDGLLNLGWVDLVVTPDDEESTMLGRFVADRLGSSVSHVTVPRGVTKRLSAGELGPEAAEWVEAAGTHHGGRANALVIDQAAHHFRTYGTIKSLLDRVGWHCLAFAVAVDRTGISPELPHLMHDARYAALYRWPFPPKLRLDCGCDV